MKPISGGLYDWEHDCPEEGWCPIHNEPLEARLGTDLMPISLQIKGFRVQLSGPVPTYIEDRLDETCRFFVEGAKFSPKYPDEWDGMIHLYRNRKFPVGLMQRVTDQLTMFEHPFDVIDYRMTEDPIQIDTNPEMDLRPYQKPIVGRALRRGNGMIQLPTGGGKTVIFCHIAAKLGRPAMVLVPTTDLVAQTIEAMNDVCGVTAAQATTKWLTDPDREWESPYWAVTTWQAVNTLLDDLAGNKYDPADVKKNKQNRRKQLRQVASRFDVLVIDEAHIAGAQCVHEVAGIFAAKYRFGTSATPFRTNGDDIRMFASVGEKVGGITPSELIRLGWLVPPNIQFTPIPRIKCTDYEKWQLVYKEGVVEHEVRNSMIVKDAVRFARQGLSTLVMCQQIRHGTILQKMITEELDRDDVFYVNGKVAAKKRAEMTRRFKSGELPIGISSSVWNQGIDFPVIGAMVLAGPYKSNLANLQRIGRGLRPFCYDCKSIEYLEANSHGSAEWTCGHDRIKIEVQVQDYFDQVPYIRDWGLDRWDLYNSEPEFIVS